MANISINNQNLVVPDGITIIQACEIADIEIPRFCYHEKLAIAGNCRMCLVEVVGGPPKPVASCAMNVTEGMQIHTNTEMVKKAREGVMEFLLVNHPLDCPICDQAGECDLQDQAYQYGKGKSDYHEHKRAVKDKNMGPLIKTQMTRCIHCTRCVRFIEDIAGTCEIGAIGRGENMEITTYLEKNINSELSGNVIDLCPVGALTSKPYAFKARSWELKKTNSIDLMDAMGSNIRIDSRGVEVMRILPIANDDINEEWLSDKARFCYDGLKYQRLDKFFIKNSQDQKLQAVDQEQAFNFVNNLIKNNQPNQIAALSGSLSAIEEIYTLKNILDQLNITNYDCRLTGQKIDSKDRASYLFNSEINGIDQADFCLLIGVNPKKDAPILNARIRKRFLSKKLKIISIGVNADLNYPHQNLGDNLEILQQIANNQHPICQQLQQAKKPMLIIGEDAVSHEDGELIQFYCKKIVEEIFKPIDNFQSYNFIAKSSGLINGLELGFTSIGGREIVDQCFEKKIKTLILLGVDDDIDFDKLKDTNIIYIGSHGDKGANHATVILPASAFSEKNALYLNLEGRIQESRKAVFSPQNILEDWQLLNQLAKKLNINFSIENHQQLKEKIFLTHSHFANLEQISKAKWLKNSHSQKQEFKNKILNFRDYDYYLTNAIARSSRILNKCSNEIKN
jgi:NADH-quinone oxidoreductase subunit G